MVRVSVVLQRTVGDSDWRFDNLSGDIAPSVDGIYVSDLIGQLNCHFIGCKTR